MKILHFIIAVAFTLPSSAVESLDQQNDSLYPGSSDISEMVHKIIQSKLSSCNVLSLRDEYFEMHFNSHSQWMWKINRPIYTMTLNDAGKIASQFPQIVPKSNGVFCLAMVIICKRIESCAFSNLKRFVEVLKKQGMIRLYRKALIYIEEETTATTRPPVKFLTFKRKTYGSNKSNNSNILSQLSITFEKLGVHITLIRRLANYGQEIKLFLNRNGISSSRSVYQLLTWSVNWLPGGSPVLMDIWSPLTGFWRNENIRISTKNFQAGGRVRFALSGTRLLPFIKIEPDGQYIGISAEIIHILERKLKISPKFIEAKDNRAYYGGGIGITWQGVVGYVIRKDAEFALGSLNFHPSLLNYDIRLSPQLHLLQASLVCERPKNLPRWPIVLLPFKPIAWSLTVISFVAVLILLKACNFVETQTGVSPSHFSISPSTPTNWLLAFGPLLQRPVNIQGLSPRTSVRLIFGAWLVTTVVLSASYMYILIGKFSVPPKERPMETIRDLLQGEKPWDVTFTVKNYLTESADPVEKEVVDKSQDLNQAADLFGVAADNKAYGNFMNHTRGCLVAERKRAKYIIYYFSERIGNGYRKPSIRLSKETFYLGPVGWAMRGDIDFLFIYTLVSYFNVYREIGILRRTELTYARRPQTFDDEDLKNPSALTLQVLGVTFLLLLIGYFLSTFAFLMELITKESTQRIHKMHTKSKRETDRSSRSSGKSTAAAAAGDKSIDQITIQSEKSGETRL